MRRSLLPPARDPPQILKKADDATLELKAEKDGKIRITSMGWDEPVILLPDQALEIVWVEGPNRIFAQVADAGAEHVGMYKKTPVSERQYCKKRGGHLMTNHPPLKLVDVFAATIPTLKFNPGVRVNYAETVLPIQDGLPKFFLRNLADQASRSLSSLLTWSWRFAPSATISETMKSGLIASTPRLTSAKSSADAT